MWSAVVFHSISCCVALFKVWFNIELKVQVSDTTGDDQCGAADNKKNYGAGFTSTNFTSKYKIAFAGIDPG